MVIGIIVQARMGSRRFPGKVVRQVNEKPLLHYLLDSLNRCSSIDKIVVATSKHESDTAIAKVCEESGANYYRGPLYDVAGRFKEVLECYQFDGFARISGDSPLLDYRLVNQVSRIFQSDKYDIVTNVFPRSFPLGQSVEMLSSEIFLNSYPDFNDEEDFEHVTQFFYKNHTRYSIYNVVAKMDYSNISLAVDTIEDMEVVKKIMSDMNNPHWKYSVDEIVRIYRKIISREF